MNLSVEVISDVICPWCFIGKRRSENAIAAHGESVKIQWHAFQLNRTRSLRRSGKRVVATNDRVHSCRRFQSLIETRSQRPAKGFSEGTFLGIDWLTVFAQRVADFLSSCQREL